MPRTSVQALASSPTPVSSDDLRLADLIADYEVALRVAGRSPRTIRWYADHLREFTRFLERDGQVATLGDLRPPAVRRWLVALQAGRERALAPSSVAGRVRTLRAFASWVAREFDLPANPLRGLPVPRVPERLVASLREPDVRELLRGVDEGSSQPERDRAIILLLLDTGVRLQRGSRSPGR